MTEAGSDGSENLNEHWVKEPTEVFHGIRVVDHDGTVFIEQIDKDGEKHQSIMVRGEEEVSELSEALIEVADRDV